MEFAEKNGISPKIVFLKLGNFFDPQKPPYGLLSDPQEAKNDQKFLVKFAIKLPKNRNRPKKSRDMGLERFRVPKVPIS